MAYSKPAVLDTRSAPAALYCVMGDELLLRTETMDALRKYCRDYGYSDRTTLSLDAKSDWDIIIESTQNLSLFSEKKLLELTILEGKPGRAGSLVIQELTESIQQKRISDTVVVIYLPKLDRTSQQSKWAKVLLQTAKVITLPTITREQMPEWIQSRLIAQNQRVDETTLSWLVDRVEGNLLAAQQEILKLGLNYPEGLIKFQNIESAVQDVARYDIFSLSNAMLQGDAERTVRIVKGLEAEGETLPLVLGFVIRDVRDLYALAQARSQGIHPSSITRKLAIFPPRDRLILKALDRLSLNAAMGLIQHAHDIDRMFKGFPVAKRLNNAWEEFLRLSLRIAAPQTVI